MGAQVKLEEGLLAVGHHSLHLKMFLIRKQCGIF